MIKIIENKEFKAVSSPFYNFRFRKEDGLFMRWGKTEEDDPLYSIAPEILDIEISSGGDCLGNCPYCYKCNGGDQPTYNMKFEDFKTIIDKFPRLLTQIAFGIMNISTNPDFFKMMEYARAKGIVPNYTCHGLDVTNENAHRTAELGGAVSVSIVDKKRTYEAIKTFLEAGVKQVKIHYMLSEETYDKAFEIIDDISNDKQLRMMQAIVFLQYKAKGRNPDGFHPVLEIEKYRRLIEYCEKNNINYGFDSCSAHCFIECVKDRENSKELISMAEPCESGLFSSYISCKGIFYPCSFAEGEGEWVDGIDVLHCDNFLKDVWFNEKVVKWRKKLISECRECPIYELSFNRA